MKKNVKYSSAESVTFRGEQAVLIKGKYIDQDIEHHCWIAPHKGYSVLRIAAVRTNPASPERAVCMCTDNEIALDERSGIWFPSKVHVQVFDDGKLLDERRADIHTAEFNRPIPAEVFSLAGLDIDAGTPVYDSEQAKSLMWSGTTLTDNYSGPVPKEWKDQAVPLSRAEVGGGVRSPEPGGNPWWVYAAAAGLAAIGLALLALARRTRR